MEDILGYVRQTSEESAGEIASAIDYIKQIAAGNPTMIEVGMKLGALMAHLSDVREEIMTMVGVVDSQEEIGRLRSDGGAGD